MKPGFLESFQPEKNVGLQKREGDGSMPTYPPWNTVDRVFVSINVLHTHWALGELDLKSWVLTIYDSCGDMFKNQVLEQVSYIKSRLHLYLKEINYYKRFHLKSHKPKIKVVYPSYEVPLQTGTLGDCGPWWCTFVEQRISGSNVFCSGSTSEYAMQFRRRMTSIMHHSIIAMQD